MALHTFICLFDLAAYDHRVAPALRRYAAEYDPAPVVALLREATRLEPSHGEDYQHWEDSLGPDAGYKPSEQTLHEVSDMLIRPLCIPRMQEIDKLAAYLSPRSEWFADLMDGGEELAGGRLEFTVGTGALIATKQQIAQFIGELRRVPPPYGDLARDYANLRELLDRAEAARNFTVLKTALSPIAP